MWFTGSRGVACCSLGFLSSPLDVPWNSEVLSSPSFNDPNILRHFKASWEWAHTGLQCKCSPLNWLFLNLP